MTLYVSETLLREVTLEALQLHVRSVTDIRILRRPGPFRPRNWTIEWLNVLVEDYGTARDFANKLEAEDHWIMVPDRHDLAGQVYGKETAARWQGPED